MHIWKLIFIITFISEVGLAESKFELISGFGYYGFDSQIKDADSFSGYVLQSKVLISANPIDRFIPYFGFGISYIRASDDDTEVGITRSTRISGGGTGIEVGAAFLFNSNIETQFGLGYDLGWYRTINTSVSGSIGNVSLSSHDENKVDAMACKQLIMRALYLTNAKWKFGGELNYDFWGNIAIDRDKYKFSGTAWKLISSYALK